MFVLILFASWSLLAWAAHALLGWPGRSAADTTDWAAWIGNLAMPAWLEPWVPAPTVEALKSTLLSWAPAIEAGLTWLPELASWLTPAIWFVWAAGAFILVASGAMGSFAVSFLRRRARGSSRSTTPSAA